VKAGDSNPTELLLKLTRLRDARPVELPKGHLIQQGWILDLHIAGFGLRIAE